MDMDNSRPMNNRVDVQENVLDNVILVNEDSLLSIKENSENKYNDLKITITNKNIDWYRNLIIEGDNNTKFKIKHINLNNRNNYKIAALISSYLSYVDYFNKVTLSVNELPNVEHVGTIHSNDIISTVDSLLILTQELKVKIKTLKTFIENILINNIQNGDIVIEEITFKYYVQCILDNFRISRPTAITQNKIETL